MGNSAITTEERVGLGVAVVAHVALVAALVFRPATPPISTPERIAVTLSDNVGLTSTSPEPAAEAAPDFAPTLGEAPAFEPAPEPEPVPSSAAKPEPAPRPLPRPKPREVPAPAPRPKATPRAQPAPKARPTTPARAQPRSEPRANRDAPAGASRFSDAFKEGVPGAQSKGQSRNTPAAGAGPSQASLAGAIKRELTPHWVSPQGADAEKLITFLAWNLNRDGSLAGTPRVVRQEGITDANRPQAARHAEQAIRAVQLAAPFALPEQYYDSWKRISSFRFDRRLSQ